MISKLRRTHRAAFVVLAAGLPLLLVTGLSVRTEPAAVELLPAALLGEEEPFEGDWNHADALLYWAPLAAGVGEALPAGSRLLGSVREGASSAAADTLGGVPTGGFLVVYSLATQQVVDSLPTASEGSR